MTTLTLPYLLALLVVACASGCATMHNSTTTMANAMPEAGRTARKDETGDNSMSVATISANQPILGRLPSIDASPAEQPSGNPSQISNWIGEFATSPLWQANPSDPDTHFMDQQVEEETFAMPRTPFEVTRLPPVEIEDFTYSDMFREQWIGIRSDHAEFYSLHSLTWLAGGVGTAGLMANTGFDEQFIRDAYLDSVVLAPSDELYEKLHQPKFLGDGFYTIPVFAIAALAEPLVDYLPLGSETAEWGQRSLRTILVGGPPLLGLQPLTGGGRPDETHESSEWRPFQDNNGVSGHAFMGAIPFISAAKMTDKMWLKGGLYAASTLPAISRVNDDAHYFSQAFLGWWLAYLAESAVDRSHNPDSNHRFFVYPQTGGMGIGLEYIH